MAELTYNDVRRAAQDAVRELHSIITGLKTNSDNIHRHVQQQTGSQNQLADLTTRLNILQNQITNLETALKAHQGMQTLQNVQQNLQDLHRRLAITEEFVRFIYTYFSEMQKQSQQRNPQQQQ
jgi:exonuclease VII small subunit